MSTESIPSLFTPTKRLEVLKRAIGALSDKDVTLITRSDIDHLGKAKLSFFGNLLLKVISFFYHNPSFTFLMQTSKEAEKILKIYKKFSKIPYQEIEEARKTVGKIDLKAAQLLLKKAAARSSAEELTRKMQRMERAFIDTWQTLTQQLAHLSPKDKHQVLEEFKKNEQEMPHLEPSASISIGSLKTPTEWKQTLRLSQSLKMIYNSLLQGLYKEQGVNEFRTLRPLEPTGILHYLDNDEAFKEAVISCVGK